MLMHAQRGQTLPFWAGIVFIVLSMFALVANYVNTVGWQFHAQNAADSAAIAGLSVRTDYMNEMSTLLYAAAVDEYRIRAVNQGMLNAMNGYGCRGNGSVFSPAHCTADYKALYEEMYALVQGDSVHDAVQGDFKRDVRDLHNFACPGSDPIVGTPTYNNCFNATSMDSDAEMAVTSYGSSCGTKGLDCAFVYNVIQHGTSENFNCANSLNCYLEQMDVIACARVPFFLGALLNLPVSGTGYQPRVVGRAAYGIVPLSPTTFTPTETQQPPESAWWVGGSQYSLTDTGNQFFDVDFKGLSLYLLWYTASIEDPTFMQQQFPQGTSSALAVYSGNASPQNKNGTYGCL